MGGAPSIITVLVYLKVYLELLLLELAAADARMPASGSPLRRRVPRPGLHALGRVAQYEITYVCTDRDAWLAR